MKKFLSLVISLTVISAVCSGILAYINNKTKEPIANTNKEKTLRAAREVMPSGVTEVVENKDKNDNPIFQGLDENGNIVGYAIIGKDSGGYGGDIVLMVGFKADKKTVVCYKAIKAAETPGLGSKLSSPEFSGQFANKDVELLKLTKDGGSIQAITAATITSRAVCKAIENAKDNLQNFK